MKEATNQSYENVIIFYPLKTFDNSVSPVYLHVNSSSVISKTFLVNTNQLK